MILDILIPDVNAQSEKLKLIATAMDEQLFFAFSNPIHTPH